VLALYAGAFLGPFAGNVVAVLLPALQAWYGVEVGVAALAVTAYVGPFAAAQCVTGATIAFGAAAAATLLILPCLAAVRRI
jgi:hypothetical protein